MSADRRAKDKAMAAYLKERRIIRTTSQCVWGCGRAIPVGGSQLLIHLNTCKGPAKKLRYKLRALAGR